MNSYDSVTPSRRPVVLITLAVTIAVSILGISVSAAQDVDPSMVSAQSTLAPIAPAAQAGPSEEVLDLIAQIEERDHHIAVLQEQLAFVRQAQLSSEVYSNEQNSQISTLQASGVISNAANDEAMNQWRAGYALGDGQNLTAFEDTILPCESGNEPNPDVAVGATDDWGRAQINRPTWKKRFESLTGADFELNIVNPILNGYMAAHVEEKQGLTAWTCWRKR